MEKEQQANLKILSALIEVPPGLAVIKDKKTGAKSVYFPFQFPDGEMGAIIVTRLVKMGWKPEDSISTIKIDFK